MGDVLFYHLTERPLDATLPVLLEKSLEAGWRVAVRGGDAAVLARLDDQLWLRDGFLPHGRAGGPHDADQPVLLTEGAAANAPDCLMLVAGAEFSPDESARLSRTCILFDDGDPRAVDQARAYWRAATEAGLRAQYWADDGGRWVKKAESGT